MTNEVFIVAGGPSLKGFNWSRLNGKDIIAINRSYEVLPNAKYIYFADHDFFANHQADMLAHQGQIITGYASNICKKQIVHPQVWEYKLTGPNGLDTQTNCIRHGRNGGYAAINVAFHLGYKTIYLMGYDMGRKESDTHWHDGHPRIDPESIYDTMLGHYATIAEPLKNNGVQVFNTNPDSRLKSFPFISIEVALSSGSKCEAITLDV
jgi:hypothetical protein